MSVENRYKQQDWDEYYKNEKKIHIKTKKGFFSFYDLFLCNCILEKYLPRYQGNDESRPKMCEIGSGDGKLVRQLADSFNYQSFGIEYSEAAAKNAQVTGVNTIISDAFDEKMLKTYAESFDLVYSYGFVEHILPPQKAVAIHLALLKKGGYFFIQIPRLKGFNYLKAKIFRPDLLPLHNLKIMEEETLREACVRDDVQEIFCGKYGTIKLRLPLAKRNFGWYIMKILSFPDRYILNPLLRLIFGKKGLETKLFSPCVIFIGRKIK
ncbi:TPA: hypothetical protein DCZ15_01315 [Candidatus Falkowbacteria bacterium]|nr:MAG: hypothetical protein UV95_C0003G0125 [Candidatus Falkowbacteria bacterium GW2011_GWF2_43_32]HBA36494.1 hypothetical protein [Candidatus Falkowbacteria bacterium]